jgi:hypothetical protein
MLSLRDQKTIKERELRHTTTAFVLFGLEQEVSAKYKAQLQQWLDAVLKGKPEK